MPDTDSSAEHTTLTGILSSLAQSEGSEKINVGQVIKRFEYRGFGPLLLVPSLIVILPTGAIPLVPALAGLLLSFICVQILIGYTHPWIPHKIKECTLPRDKFEKGVGRAKPYTQKIDTFLHKRWAVLFNPVSTRLTALVCLILCMLMTVVGFIPMMPAVLALPVFFFGLGYIAEDGLVIAVGLLTVIGSLIALSYYLA